MPVFITYQRGSRHLFVAEKRVLSPPGVEGASFPTSASQEQGRRKEPVHDEGPSGEPSGERETEFVLLHDDEIDTKPTNAELREVIQEKVFITLLLSRFWWTISWDCRVLLGRTSSPMTFSALRR